MKSNIILLIVSFFSLTAQSQSVNLEGRWVVKKIDRVLSNGAVIVDYNSDSLTNLVDVSQMVLEHKAHGILSGQTIYGTPLVTGTWSTVGDQIIYNDKSFDLEIISENEFKTSKPYNFTTPTGLTVESTIEKTYIKEFLLPISIQSFNVDQNGKTAFLSWESSGENNFAYFEIEKSINGEIFNKIGEVNSTGSNSNYNFEDEEAFAQANTIFYRLKMVDHDDSFRYSQVKSISTAREQVEIFPNPTRSVVTYRQPSNTATSYKVLDINGRLLSSRETQDSGTIDLASFPKGAYHLIFLQGKKAIHYDRVLKF